MLRARFKKSSRTTVRNTSLHSGELNMDGCVNNKCTTSMTRATSRGGCFNCFTSSISLLVISANGWSSASSPPAWRTAAKTCGSSSMLHRLRRRWNIHLAVTKHQLRRYHIESSMLKTRTHWTLLPFIHPSFDACATLSQPASRTHSGERQEPRNLPKSFGRFPPRRTSPHEAWLHCTMALQADWRRKTNPTCSRFFSWCLPSRTGEVQQTHPSSLNMEIWDWTSIFHADPQFVWLVSLCLSGLSSSTDASFQMGNPNMSKWQKVNNSSNNQSIKRWRPCD